MNVMHLLTIGGMTMGMTFLLGAIPSANSEQQDPMTDATYIAQISEKTDGIRSDMTVGSGDTGLPRRSIDPVDGTEGTYPTQTGQMIERDPRMRNLSGSSSSVTGCWMPWLLHQPDRSLHLE